MKKLLTLIIVLLTGSAVLYAQNTQQVKQLATLAKVWGFLKYYHPDAAKGKPDWDKELVRMIPLVKAAASSAEFDRLIADWYHTLPKARLAPSVSQLKSDTIVRIFDESDIGRFGVSKLMQDELTRLYLYHEPDSSKYINNFDGKYHYDHIFHNEDEYPGMAYPDESYRLLALFRYWNVINYFYPYKKINAKNWNEILPAFIPRFIACRDSDEYRRTFLLLTARLKDSHSFFAQDQWNKTHPTYKLPFEVSWINGRYYISKTSRKPLIEEMGFKIGDELTGINGRPVSMRENELKPVITGTNELSVHRNIANALFSIDTNRAITLSINRQGAALNKTARLLTWNELNKLPLAAPPKLWENLGHDVWMVRFCRITKPDTLRKLFADLQRAKTVIWDMRDYPSFAVVQGMGKGLYTQKTPSTITYNGILAFPGALTRRIEGTAYTATDTLQLPIYTGKMIVLVNEQTQSLSESVAYELSLRPNTIVMGSQTAGTTGNITWIGIPGGIEASFTAVGVEGLKGSFKEGQGVKIDKEITLTPDDLTKYPDYLLEMAYREAVGKNL